ncbi:CHAD domain-containing protein [Zhihengliuella salsuginis]|uniref:CHAD domain-containing protein n=1 Tax=Zhihengliuella salsuginis TaxID=578222 RepID=A0ABQ3GJ04_9MICC|nr:CHAD domain-containing protein [Zhihengliuella salsuginis]GHD06270.1 hypothetical protein GCM10008096_16070 [Zhihengliuella salsuginis]
MGTDGGLRPVLSAALGRAADELRAWDVRARGAEPDAVHQLRIAERTLRGLLKATRHLFEPGTTTALEAHLRNLGRGLSATRDAEAGLELLAARAPGSGGAAVPADVVVRLRSVLQAERDGAAAATRHRLESDGHRRMLDAAATFAADPPLDAANDAPAKKPLRKAVDRQLRRVLRAAEAAAGADDHNAALHEVRKQAKILRYTIGVLEAVPGAHLGGARRSLRTRAEAVQDALGEYGDSAAFQELVCAAADAARADGEEAFAYGVLYAGETDVQRRALARYRTALADLRRG